MANGGRASRQTRVLRALLTVALSLPALAAAEAPTPVESADAVEQAEQYAARAFEAYQQGRHADAVALYEQAYASAPSADALYNIARIYDVGLHDRSRAIAAYERCLLERGATPERLQRAGERIVQLRRSEAQELPSERWPAEASVQLPPAPSTVSDQEPRHGWSTLRGAAVISGAVGVVSVGAGLGFGVAAMSDADRANAACTGNRCRTQRGVDAAKSASARATLATAGVGVGAALLATSVTLWILGANGETEREAPPRVSFTPVAGERELGMAVQGKW